MPRHNPDWRTRNIGRLLLCAADTFVTDKLRILNDSGFGPASQVHVALVQNLDPRGTRLSSVALRAGMTKQSMLELVDRAEALGLVERHPESGDRRAKAVAFTPKGRQVVNKLKDGLDEAERLMAIRVGAAFLRLMMQKLGVYGDASNGVDGAPTLAEGNVTGRVPNVGHVLGSAFGVFTRDVQRTLHDSGFAAVSEVHMTLFRNLDLQGTRPTELASRARMTKQAMTNLVRRTEVLGLVRQVADAHDGRAKTVVLTPDGVRLMDRTRTGILRAEQRMATAVGEMFFHDLKQRLAAYVAGTEASYLAADIGELASTRAMHRSPGTIRPSTDLQATDWGVESGRSPSSLRVMRSG